MKNETIASDRKLANRNRAIANAVACLIGIAINVAGSRLAEALPFPVYLDSVGTVAVAATRGGLPGVLVGLFTNMAKAASDPTSVYYASVNVAIAAIVAWAASKGAFSVPRKIWKLAGLTAVLGAIGGGFGSVVTWLAYDLAEANGNYAAALASRVATDGPPDFVDKAVTVAIAAFFVAAIRKAGFDDVEERRRRVRDAAARARISLKTKTTMLVSVAMVGTAAATVTIGTVAFRDDATKRYEAVAVGAAATVADAIDPEKVGLWIREGEEAEGYAQTKERLEAVRRNHPGVLYTYVYAIKEDGCHVVFDLDANGLEGASPGEVIPFDESFAPLVPTLLAGGRIDPIVTDDTYGRLMTAYEPVYDSEGRCACYAAVDVAISSIDVDAATYAGKMASLFACAFMVALAFAVTGIDRSVVEPVDSMSEAAEAFGFGSEEERARSVDRLENLDVRTGDEIERLHEAFVKTAVDCVDYAAEAKAAAEALAQTQSGLIMTLAQVVESRDETTGQHVRRTAEYSKIIMDEMRRQGAYPDVMTDEFVESVAFSAPLHDVGKISIPDAILNKTGRLTDEEFEVMRSHTTKGKEIVEKAIEAAPMPELLVETMNVAECHHEKWDGTGYPNGLAGEDVPLSARIVAVADVFDALTSRRSYKSGMPFEKAFGIVKDGSGTHFDPKVVDAFVGAKDEIEAAAEKYAD